MADTSQGTSVSPVLSQAYTTRDSLSREQSRFSYQCERRGGEEEENFRREFPLLAEEISFGGENRPRLPTCPRKVFWIPVNRAQLVALRVPTELEVTE